METISAQLKKEINELSSKEFLNKYKDVIVYEKTQLKRKDNNEFHFGNDKPYIDLPEDYYELIPSDYVVFDSFCYPVFEEDTLVRNTQQLKAINPELSADDILIGVYRIYSDIVDTNKIIEVVETVMNTDCKGLHKKEWKRDDTYWCHNKNELTWQARQGFARKYRACEKAGIDMTLTIEENARRTNIPVRRLKEWNESLNLGLKSEKELENDRLIQLIKENMSLSVRNLVELAKEHGLKAGKDKINKLRNEII